MKQDRELVYDVYLGEYQVSEEAVPDIIEHVGDDVCPMCKTNCTGVNAGPPEAGDTVLFICPECDIEISIEAWLVK